MNIEGLESVKNEILWSQRPPWSKCYELPSTVTYNQSSHSTVVGGMNQKKLGLPCFYRTEIGRIAPGRDKVYREIWISSWHLRLVCGYQSVPGWSKYCGPPSTVQYLSQQTFVGVCRIEEHWQKIPLKWYLDMEKWCLKMAATQTFLWNFIFGAVGSIPTRHLKS